jgi:DNA mismatch repair ATPase MutS
LSYNLTLESPSTDIKEITSRLDLLELFYNDAYLSEIMSDHLGNVKDIEKALQRMHIQSNGGIDLLIILESLQHIQKLKLKLISLSLQEQDMSLKEKLNQVAEKLGDFSNLLSNYNGLFKVEKLAEIGKISVDIINQGFCSKIDLARESLKEVQCLINERESELSNLFGKIFGYVEKKCTLNFDSRLGPVVEITKGVDKTNARIENLIKTTQSFHSIVGYHGNLKKFIDDVDSFLIQEWSKLYLKSQALKYTLSELQKNTITDACDMVY